MRETILRIRTFDKLLKKFVENPKIKYDSPQVIYCNHSPTEIITHYSGVNDSNGKMIYEGDIIKLSGHDEIEFGVVEMEKKGLNDKMFYLRPLNEKFKTTANFIIIETPTIGDKRITGLFTTNDYPINKENGTGFSNGTISEIVGNIFEPNKTK